MAQGREGSVTEREFVVVDEREGWQEVRLRSGRLAYYDTRSQVTTFEKPAAFQTLEELQRDAALRSGDLAGFLSQPRRAPADASAGATDAAAASSSAAAGADVAGHGGGVGLRLLRNMGWEEGSGLGQGGDGIQQALQVEAVHGTAGLGLGSEEEEGLAEAARERRRLDIEVEQTAEEVRRRDAERRRQEQLQEDIKSMNRGFFCEACSKQYKSSREMAAHLDSLAHAHAVRLKELIARAAPGEAEGMAKKRKEERRMEREMRRRLNAAAATAAPGSAAGSAPDTAAPPAVPGPASSGAAAEPPPELPAERPVKIGLSLGSMKKKGRGFRR